MTIPIEAPPERHGRVGWRCQTGPIRYRRAEAQETTGKQSTTNKRLDRLGSDFREPRDREGLVPPVPGHEHGADDRRGNPEGAQAPRLASLEVVDCHEATTSNAKAAMERMLLTACVVVRSRP